MERGQLLAQRRASHVLRGHTKRTTYHAKTVRREHTRRVTRVHANHAARGWFPKRKRRNVPSVRLVNTPISMRTYANHVREAHTPLDLLTSARSAQQALTQELARINATSVVQGKTLIINISIAQIAVRPITPPTPTQNAANAQKKNTQASVSLAVRSAHVEQK